MKKLVGLSLKTILVIAGVGWLLVCIECIEHILQSASEWYHYLPLLPLSFLCLVGVGTAYMGLDLPLGDDEEKTDG